MKTHRTSSGHASYPGPGWRSWPDNGAAVPLFGRLLGFVLRRRRLIAALLLCAAAALAVQQLTPAAPATTPVLVAAKDLPAGHILSPGDIRAADVSPNMIPEGAFAAGSGPPERIVGQVSGPVRRGEVLTDASLLGAGLLTGAPPGSQAVPVRLSDPSTLALLRQGQLVTVVLSSSSGLDGPVSNEVLADNVPVLWTPALASDGGGLFPAQETEAVVVVAASPEQAVRLAGAINRGKVFLILLN